MRSDTSSVDFAGVVPLLHSASLVLQRALPSVNSVGAGVSLASKGWDVEKHIVAGLGKLTCLRRRA